MNKYAYLIAPIIGWLVAQAIKFGLTLRKDGFGWGDFVQSGGMPSSHSAFMVALATLVGLSNGLTSVSFGIAAALTGIIIYDAMGVRRTTGQQTDAINELAKLHKVKLKSVITVSRGHTPVEAFVGSMVGLIVGACCFAFL